MNKTKVIFSDYDALTGISMVTIDNKYGRYKGFAVVHDSDKEHASPVTGREIAEIRANQVFFKDRIKQLEWQKHGVQRLTTMLSQTKPINKMIYFSMVMRQCKRMITAIDKEIAWYQRKIDSSNQYIKANF